MENSLNYRVSFSRMQLNTDGGGGEGGEGGGGTVASVRRLYSISSYLIKNRSLRLNASFSLTT